MHRVPATAGPLVLVHSRALAAAEPWWALLPVHVQYSLAERQLSPCPNRGLAHAYAPVSVADRREPPSEPLRPQSCECSPPAQPYEWPPREPRVLVSLPGTSDMPGLVRAEPQ